MFVIEIPYLSLRRLASTKQGLRWKELSDPEEKGTRVDSHSKYIIPVGNKVIKVEQKKERFAFSCNDDDFFEIWYNFFDLQFDYEEAVGLIHYNTVPGSEMRKLLWKGKSIRILNHDLLETIITQVLIEGKPIWEAKYLVERFCSKFGEKHKQAMLESGKVTWYGFPDLERLSEITYESLNFLGLKEKQEGFFELITNIVEGDIDLEELRFMSYDESMEYLMACGIKKLTAKYICLYALGHKDSFPISREIKDMIEGFGYYPYDFLEWELEPYEGYRGLIYQYMEFDLNWKGGHDGTFE